MNVDYLIIGAGVAGTTAAETIRARDERGSIVLVGDEPHPLYSRVMLPMVVDRRIPAEKAYLKTDEWYASARIEYLRGRRVSALDAATHRATLDDGTEIVFGKALIATGGRPKRLDVPGERLDGVYRLQTLDDATAVRDSVRGPAVVVGGGFIALEFVNGFMHYGLKTTVCLRNHSFWSRHLDATGSALLERHLAAKGVKIMKDVVPLAFIGDTRVEGVKLSNGESIPCASIGIGIGLEPNVHAADTVARSAHGVLADEYLTTSAPEVYAAGDIADFEDVLAGHRHVLGNWMNAKEQGRVAGLNMAGERTRYERVSSYSVTALGLNVAFVGDVGSEGNETIARGDGETSYASLIIRDGKLRGGVFLNRVADRGPCAELIKSGKDVSAFRKELADTNFDLKSLLQ